MIIDSDDDYTIYENKLEYISLCCDKMQKCISMLNKHKIKHININGYWKNETNDNINEKYCYIFLIARSSNLVPTLCLVFESPFSKR